MRKHKIKNTSIEKALKILLAFAPYNQEMSTTELSEKLGFHKATVSRTLQVLTRYGLLMQNPQTKKYMLGSTIIQLGGTASQFLRTSLIQIARPHLDGLRERLKETVAMEVLAGGNSFMAYVAEGPQRVRIAATVGEMLPKHAAAGAKAILAFSSPDIQSQIFDWSMKRFTANTIVSPKQFLRHLQVTREEGVAFDNEEIDRGVSAFGSPIFDHEGKPIAAVVVVGPSQRIALDNKSEIIRLLKDTAATISAQLQNNAKPQGNTRNSKKKR
jgi:DNA-binding IclR family transcriptional regulator